MDVDISGGTLSRRQLLSSAEFNLSLLLGQMHFKGKDFMINTKILKSLNSVKEEILFYKEDLKTDLSFGAQVRYQTDIYLLKTTIESAITKSISALKDTITTIHKIIGEREEELVVQNKVLKSWTSQEDINKNDQYLRINKLIQQIHLSIDKLNKDLSIQTARLNRIVSIKRDYENLSSVEEFKKLYDSIPNHFKTSVYAKKIITEVRDNVRKNIQHGREIQGVKSEYFNKN
jgi:hypothetical protein